MSRYMLIMRSTPEAEAAMAEENIDFDEIIAQMGRYNEELIKAGVMLAGEGLTDPDEGFVVDFNADPPVVTDGPYTEVKEVLAGYQLVDVESEERAIEIAAQVSAAPGPGGVPLRQRIEVRRLMGALPEDDL